MTQNLIDGFLDFRRQAYDSPHGTMRALMKLGQSPDYFIISCIDSRGNPGNVFQSQPGTFFSHKAMGAIVRPYKKGTALAAALQFALKYNKVKHIIILGHTGCGAVKALIDNIPDEDIASFVDVARSALNTAKKLASAEETHDDLYRHAEEQIVLQSAENLRGYPPVQQALSDERITIKPWLFDMHEGDLLEYSPDHAQFLSLIHTAPTEKRAHA